jgi:hypothetical protein
LRLISVLGRSGLATAQQPGRGLSGGGLMRPLSSLLPATIFTDSTADATRPRASFGITTATDTSVRQQHSRPTTIHRQARRDQRLQQSRSANPAFTATQQAAEHLLPRRRPSMSL